MAQGTEARTVNRYACNSTQATGDAGRACHQRASVTGRWRWPFLLLRVLWSAENGPDRVRLTRPDIDLAALRARFVRAIQRAERFALSQDRAARCTGT